MIGQVGLHGLGPLNWVGKKAVFNLVQHNIRFSSYSKVKCFQPPRMGFDRSVVRLSVGPSITFFTYCSEGDECQEHSQDCWHA